MATIPGDDILEVIGLDIEADLRSLGVAKDDAAKMAVHVTQKLRFLYGGSHAYFTKDHHKKLNERDIAIFESFNGKNYTELAFQYGLSEMRIRQIIEKIVFGRRAERVS